MTRESSADVLASKPTIDLSKFDVLDSASVKRALAGNNLRHYVYVLLRPNQIPFYVGKGTKGNGVQRVLQHEAEARGSGKSYKLNIIRAVWAMGATVGYILYRFSDNETEMLAEERLLISTIGRHDLKKGPLANLTDGGEGTSNPSEESRQARRETLAGDGGDDIDRAVANEFFQRITSVESVPIKPVEKIKIGPLFPINKNIGPSARQAAALASSAIANRVMLAPGALIPRRLTVSGKLLIIENGVGRDILRTGLAVLATDANPGEEVFRLSEFGYRYILATLDRDMLEDAGVVEPRI